MTDHYFNLYSTYILLNYRIINPLAFPHQQSQTLVLLLCRKKNTMERMICKTLQDILPYLLRLTENSRRRREIV